MRNENSTEAKRAHARYLVKKAVEAGDLAPQPCEVGVGCSARIDAHHEDYSKPLEVRWLCRRHHRTLHDPAPAETSRPRGGLTGGLVRLETRLSKDAFELLRASAYLNHRSVVAEARFALERYVEEAA